LPVAACGWPLAGLITFVLGAQSLALQSIRFLRHLGIAPTHAVRRNAGPS